MAAHLFTFLSKYKYHFLVWCIYVAYEVLLLCLMKAAPKTYSDIILHFIFNIFIFYFHLNIFLKYTLNTNNKMLKSSPVLVFLVILELIFFVFLKYLGDEFLYKYIIAKPISSTYSKTPILAMIWRAIYFMSNSTGYYFIVRDQQQRQLVEKMKKQKLQKTIWEKEIKNELISTQNAFLRAQINPHFLINTLSYLYNETRKLAPKAAESILSLSDIMQYALSKEAASGYVRLESEINLVENFLLLHQATQAYQMPLKLSYNEDVLAIPFIPLVLMTLTENMIKHGQLNDSLKPAEIKITYENSVLHIETSNHEAAKNQTSGHGIDLKHISNRLSLAYGETAVFNSHHDAQNNFYTSTMVQF